MHLDELLGDAEAQPEPSLVEAEVARGMAAGIELGEERLEQVLERLGLQADAPVLDLDHGLVLRRARRAESSIWPWSGVNLMALVSRLTSTALILSASISKVPRSSASAT